MEFTPAATLTFEPEQGVWHAERGEESFWSTGLDRALAHVEAVFGTPPEQVRISVDATIDPVFAEVRAGGDPATAADIERIARYIYDRQIPLGLHDLGELLGCEKARLSELFDRFDRAGE
ncbi:MAG: hypothetical protein HKN26_03845 [Acidimicrobiales bacterium]|nr:hypothetical protein [Acidimicrobiales bacterium]